MSARRVVLLTPNFENNSLGRTYCLWLLARHLGWRTEVLGVRGERVWSPLQGTAFADDCVLPDPGTSEALRERAVAERAHGADLLLAVKSLPTSFGVGLRLAERSGTPLLLDVDDPDVEVRTTWQPPVDRLKALVRHPRRYRDLLRLRRAAADVPVMVSNPVLQEMYGGVLVPHVRDVPDQPPPPGAGGPRPVVRFVGSPRGHKGVEQLREAIAPLGTEGYRLEVTGTAPADAAAWESWLGTTTLAEGASLVATADVIALPSLARSWSGAQLPVKLVDAMAVGRPVVASDLPVLRWAVGDTGVLVPPADVVALRGALRDLADPDLRAELGRAAHLRAQQLFSLPAVAPAFAEQVQRALGSSAPPPPPGTPPTPASAGAPS
ncbi:glycosyltransferase family 4 protein [Quadrisphaera setariae]|uniref:Glycosyltransferase family 4 protein n=1 Tax=Quadrisphaera setariae TaxID=2593304 RepID=A0A5C8ZGN0_9ACTN|nr:glycosyltransferase family 4 protein [Quadrisphaera setariae]TXR56378.1 glycosyltransferase family 4 protein [Quadrisphaera setariae]